jgi:hypothetical protein
MDVQGHSRGFESYSASHFIHCFYAYRHFITFFQSCYYFVPVRSISHLLNRKISLNIIHSFTPRHSRWFFRMGFLIEFSCFLFPSFAFHMSCTAVSSIAWLQQFSVKNTDCGTCDYATLLSSSCSWVQVSCSALRSSAASVHLSYGNDLQMFRIMLCIMETCTKTLCVGALLFVLLHE